MKLVTGHFGEIEFDLERFIIFEEGLPGFEGLKRFILIEDNDSESPFSYLQSIEDTDISFVVTDPYQFSKSYAPRIPEVYFEKLGNGESKEYTVLNIVTVPRDINLTTINLQAPLLIHINSRKGMQVNLEVTDYKTKHLLVDLVKEA